MKYGQPETWEDVLILAGDLGDLRFLIAYARFKGVPIPDEVRAQYRAEQAARAPQPDPPDPT